mgnify:CR=1 FL=1
MRSEINEQQKPTRKVEPDNIVLNKDGTVDVKDTHALNRKAKASLIVSKTFAYLFLILLSIMCLVFFYLLLVNSTKSQTELDGIFKPTFSTHFFENLKNALKTRDFIDVPTGLFNSFIVATGTTILTTYFSALTAYAIYAYRFKGRKILAVFILAIMMIPSQVSSVGFVKLAFDMNLTDRLWILIVPAIAAPSVYFYMFQYLKASLPLDLVEASRIDGSSEFMTFNRIVLPIMKPALAVQGIFTFVNSWNNYYMPGLLLHDRNKYTLPVVLGYLRSMQNSQRDAGQVWMVIFISVFPVIVIYLLLSKSIIKGVTSGSVKG